MCYAFTQRMVQGCIMQVPIDHLDKFRASLTYSTLQNDQSTSGISKRPAAEALEKQPAKSVKLSPGEDVVEVSQPAVENESEKSLKQKIASLQARLDKSLTVFKQQETVLKQRDQELKKRKEECKDFEERHDDILHRLTELEMKYGKQALPKTEQAQARAIGTAMLKIERQAIKENHDKKLEIQKKKHKQAKENYEDRIEDLKQKHEAQIRKKDAQCREKVEKAGEEAKSWKPEHSKAVKDKNSDLKAKDKKITELTLSVKQLENEKAGLETSVAEYKEKQKCSEDAMKERDKACADLRTYLDTRSADNMRLTRELGELRNIRAQDEATFQTLRAKENADIEASHAKRIEEEGKRWQAQYEKAERAAHDVVQLQRANLILRHGIDREVNSSSKIQARNAVLERKVRMLQAQANGTGCSDEEGEGSLSASGDSQGDESAVAREASETVPEKTADKEK